MTRFHMICLFIITMIIFSCNNNIDKKEEKSNENEWYKYEATNYEIFYPFDWEQKVNSGTIAFMTKKESDDDVFQENVNISVQDLAAQPMNLDQYTNLSKSQIIGAMGESAIEAVKRIDIGGKSADEMLYKINYGGKLLKIKGVWLVENNKAYVITYTAEPNKFEKYLKDSDKIINSFKLKRGTEM